MRKLFLLLTFVALSASAQDLITFKDGNIEEVRILEVSTTEVKYKMFNNLEGPTCTMKRSNLYSVKYENGEVRKFIDSDSSHSNYYSAELESMIVYTRQIDVYVQDGWGAGLLFRKELNPFAGWNILGVSYMSGWNNPKEAGIVNVRLCGIRLYSPAYDAFRFYTELNPGYTHVYINSIIPNWGAIKGNAHCFGLDFSAGFQLHKNIAIGYNLNYMVNSNGHAVTHWARLSLLL